MLLIFISLLLSAGTPDAGTLDQLTLSGLYETSSGEYVGLQFNADGSGSYKLESDTFTFSSYSLTGNGSLYNLDFTIQGINVYGVVKEISSNQIGFFSYTDQSLRNAHTTSDEFITLTKQQ
ncbi:MAG: hypothetical protein RIM99_20655 [Cyclobacteriaceae bacterium]